jgi:hypothetical protein
MLNTHLPKLETEIYRRYYVWCIDEAKKESQKDFSTLFKMNNYYTNVTLGAIHNLSKSKQVQALVCLIKHAYKVYLPEIIISQEEGEIFSEVQLQEQNSEVIRQSKGQGKLLKPVGKRILKKFLVEEFSEHLNIQLNQNLYFDFDFGNGWLIRTFLAYDRYYYSYFHHIYYTSKHGEMIRVSPPTINFSRSVGIYYSDSWCFLSEENAWESAQLIALLCRDFIEFAPRIIDSVTP